MKRAGSRVKLIFVIVTLMVLVGCKSPQAQIVGRWHSTHLVAQNAFSVSMSLALANDIEFFQDGTYSASYTIGTQTMGGIGGKYAVLDGQRVRIDYGGTGALINVYTYTLSGNSLTLTDGQGATGQFQRVQ